MADLLGVHEPGTDGTQQGGVGDLAQGEGDQQVAICWGATDGEKARFGRRMGGIGVDIRRCGQGCFDIGLGDAVLAAFWPVAGIPVETRDVRWVI